VRVAYGETDIYELRTICIFYARLSEMLRDQNPQSLKNLVEIDITTNESILSKTDHLVLVRRLKVTHVKMCFI
jgi:hypothetical protein